MNVLQNLTELYNTLPLDSTYREVAKGILENLPKMKDVTVYDIAEITNSSRTTVWRMVQKMGYKNFTDFRYALQQAVQQYNYYNRMLPAGQCKEPEDILANVKERTRIAADLLDESLDATLLQDLANELAEAKKIHFYMPFRLSFVQALQQNLSMAGKDTAYIILLPDMLMDAATLDEDSILIISTIEFAETLDMKGVFSTAHKKGAKIWLAGNSRSQYRKYAHRLLLDSDADAYSWLTAWEGFLLALSEQYRAEYIDIY